ncbi:MAG: hypothetical protein WDN09_03680 [bacterium]
MLNIMIILILVAFILYGTKRSGRRKSSAPGKAGAALAGILRKTGTAVLFTGKKILILALCLIGYALIVLMIRSVAPNAWEAWWGSLDFFILSNIAIIICILLAVVFGQTDNAFLLALIVAMLFVYHLELQNKGAKEQVDAIVKAQQREAARLADSISKPRREAQARRDSLYPKSGEGMATAEKPVTLWIDGRHTEIPAPTGRGTYVLVKDRSNVLYDITPNDKDWAKKWYAFFRYPGGEAYEYYAVDDKSYIKWQLVP